LTKESCRKRQSSCDIFISENQQLDNDSSQNIKTLGFQMIPNPKKLIQNIKLTKVKIDIIFIILRKTTGQQYYVHFRKTG